VKIKCPIPRCGQENPPDAIHCSLCGTNLQAYGRLLLMPDDLFNRGLSFSQGGHFQQAEQCLQSALLFNPRDVEVTLLLAQVQALQGDNAAATATFARAMEKSSSDPRLMNIAATLQAAVEQTHISTPAASTTAAPSQSEKPSSKSGVSTHKRKKKRH